MSGCNCKNGPNVNEILENGSVKEKKINKKVSKYTLKILAFLFFIILLPIINIYLLWVVFKMLVLNENIDIRPLLVALGNKFKQTDNEEEYYDMSELTNDDVKLLNVEGLSNN